MSEHDHFDAGYAAGLDAGRAAGQEALEAARAKVKELESELWKPSPSLVAVAKQRDALKAELLAIKAALREWLNDDTDWQHGFDDGWRGVNCELLTRRKAESVKHLRTIAERVPPDRVLDELSTKKPT